MVEFLHGFQVIFYFITWLCFLWPLAKEVLRSSCPSGFFFFFSIPAGAGGLPASRPSAYPVDPGSAARAVSRPVAPGPSLFSLCSFVLIKIIPAYGLALGGPLVQRLLLRPTPRSVMFKLAILGDQPLVSLVSSDSFRDKLGFSFTTHPISTMVALSMFKASLPAEANVAVIGCLTSLLCDISVPKTEKNREVYLSKIVRPLVPLFCCYWCVPLVLSERFLIDLGESVSGLLLSREGVRVIVVRPTLRTRPSAYKSDMIQIQVGRGPPCCPLLPWLPLCLQSHLSALSLGDPRVGVLPHFAMDSGMLSSNGSTMTSATTSKSVPG